MPKKRLALVIPAAAMAIATLSGCFDGVVRSPSEASGNRHADRRQQGSDSHRGQRRGKHQRQGERSGGVDVVTLAAVGDTAMGVTPTLPAEPATYFDPIKGELKGDVVFGNLEGTLTDVSESPKCGKGSSECFAFRAPPEYAKYLAAAGFTLMSNANNHSYDFGEAGEEETIEVLHGAGIEQTGLPEEVTVVKAGGSRVAFVGFAPYSNTASLTDLDAARDLIRQAREEADIVVVAFHAGAEGSDATHVTGEEETYLGEDRGNAEAFAQMAVEAGADLILGSGPHVLRGMEIYRKRLIAYSLGNFSGFHNFTLEGVLGETVVLHVTLAEDGAFRAGRLASVRLIEAGQPVPDPEGAGAHLVAALSKEDFGRHGVEIDSDGRIETP
jgi:poly-gamma-glutamate capsule biosynthesis protein CapA/YwtB (metallophosphatase superfamily)